MTIHPHQIENVHVKAINLFLPALLEILYE